MKTTTLAYIRVYPDGHLEAQFVLSTLNGSSITDTIAHTVTITPAVNSDLDAYFTSINANFAAEGYPAVSQTDLNNIKSQTGFTITPSVVQAWSVKQAVTLT